MYTDLSAHQEWPAQYKPWTPVSAQVRHNTNNLFSTMIHTWTISLLQWSTHENLFGAMNYPWKSLWYNDPPMKIFGTMIHKWKSLWYNEPPMKISLVQWSSNENLFGTMNHYENLFGTMIHPWKSLWYNDPPMNISLVQWSTHETLFNTLINPWKSLWHNDPPMKISSIQYNGQHMNDLFNTYWTQTNVLILVKTLKLLYDQRVNEKRVIRLGILFLSLPWPTYLIQ